jgi:thiol-disulfide isomerase/thioredoxin/uncharacterized membrane protein YphA (DoxX/SURF4 family)
MALVRIISPMSVALLVSRVLLALVFGVAGVAKLADPAGSRKSMVDFGVPAALSRVFAVLLPLVELACALALIPVRSAWVGAVGVAGLLTLFVAGITISLARGAKPDCHCFGQLHSEPIGAKTLVRNMILLGLAIFVVWQGPSKSGAGVANLLSALDPLTSAILAFSAFLVVFMSLATWLAFHLLRQNGRLLVRLEAVEQRLGISMQVMPGLPLNSSAPAFALTALEGGKVTLDALRESGKAVLLVFTEPGCGACDTLWPELAQWQEEHAGRVTIVPVSRGTIEENRVKNAVHEVRNVLLQDDRETAKAYLVTATPSAVLVVDGNVASPVATGADEIRALVGRAILPPPVKSGDPAPAIELPDLDGKPVDLASLRGRRRLLLFWNPSCGFCQQMLGDLKTWERNPPGDAPELMIISGGSLEDTRQQGFQSRVLLDRSFAVGQVFGAEGTPAAVILDEKGRVASSVGVGANAVMALAGTVPARRSA